jgi:hypothetical protein
MAFVGLNVSSDAGGGDAGGGKEVSIACGAFTKRGTVADLTSCVSGDGLGAIASSVVADRLRDLCELPESMDDRLGDFL